jgi:hypothetical protein
MLWGNAPASVLRRFSEWLNLGHHKTRSARKLGLLWIEYCVSFDAKKGNA